MLFVIRYFPTANLLRLGTKTYVATNRNALISDLFRRSKSVPAPSSHSPGVAQPARKMLYPGPSPRGKHCVEVDAAHCGSLLRMFTEE